MSSFRILSAEITRKLQFYSILIILLKSFPMTLVSCCPPCRQGQCGPQDLRPLLLHCHTVRVAAPPPLTTHTHGYRHAEGPGPPRLSTPIPTNRCSNFKHFSPGRFSPVFITTLFSRLRHELDGPSRWRTHLQPKITPE